MVAKGEINFDERSVIAKNLCMKVSNVERVTVLYYTEQDEDVNMKLNAK